MAKRGNRPGRTLVTFALGIAVLYGLVALAGSWSPLLGLDLQGGTRITLDAQGDPSEESLNEAREIINQRVNGSGVSEAQVTTQGGDVIQVEIPGDVRRDLVDVVRRQAQLRFRLVACSSVQPCTAQGGQAPGAPGLPAPPGGQPAPGQVPAPPGGPQGGGQQGGGGQQSGGQGSSNRVAPDFARSETTAPSDQTTEPSPSPGQQSPGQSPGGSPTASPTDAPNSGTEESQTFDQSAVAPLQEAVQFIRGGYTQADVQRFNSLSCTPEGNLVQADGSPASVPDNPLQPLVACSQPEQAQGDQPAQQSIKYLLSKAVIAGTDLEDASYGIPQGEVQNVVTLDIGGQGEDVFSQASQELRRNVEQFAIVLDGNVISAPTFTSPIPDGQAQITGGFTEQQASDLATSLRYGSLPISFGDPSTTSIGPTLAGDQLTAGLTAGAIGLALVMGYCMLYYRGLGIVVITSLAVAAAIVYALILLLSETAGFALTLPGIAGFIIAVGVTADSFIILFERIRDEMRDGKSMRVAVETAWARARNTCLAADMVSILAAVVLYIFASGVIKGFAFALGLTTVIDIVVFFWFTKPMVSWLARYRFFNRGHRLSGLSAGTLGVDRLPAGGKA